MLHNSSILVLNLIQINLRLGKVIQVQRNEFLLSAATLVFIAIFPEIVLYD